VLARQGFVMEFKKTVRNGVEYRFDPLTGHQSRINPQRAGRLRNAGDRGGLAAVVADSARTCPFCHERVEEKTPCFTGEGWREGRIGRGETLLFPNANPFGENHAVGIISRAHFLKLDEFSREMLQDNLVASRDYALAVHRGKREAVWPIYLWNYMPPSAGSIVHPHSQTLVESEPLPGQAELMRKSREYFDRNGTVYWQDLAEREEKTGERFIYRGDCLSLVTSFAPRGFNEIQFIFGGLSSFAEAGEREIAEFVDCLIGALRGYREIGIGSFNLITCSGPIDERAGYYRLHAKLISRPYPGGVYTGDTGPFERLCDAWVIDTLPELVAAKLKPIFR